MISEVTRTIWRDQMMEDIRGKIRKVEKILVYLKREIW
jgi:hypothetical protein